MLGTHWRPPSMTRAGLGSDALVSLTLGGKIFRRPDTFQ